MNDRYTVANGIRIYSVEEGEGPLVLLLHGWPESSYSWRHQIEPLAAAGFRAVAIDLPGYGKSDKPDVTYDIVFLTDCVAGLIEGLGQRKAVLAGHDWGGLIVWSHARLHSDQVAGVIGFNTPDLPRTPAPTVDFLRELGLDEHKYLIEFQNPGQAEERIYRDIDDYIRRVFSKWTIADSDVLSDDVLKVYADLFRPEGAMTPPLEYYRNMNRNWELLADVDDQTIDVPCLMISAADDPVLPPAFADGMESRVPNLKRVVIESCGHWTQQEQPEETNAHMIEYLKKLGTW